MYKRKDKPNEAINQIRSYVPIHYRAYQYGIQYQ